ncbi:T9SS type A sorting domain-containing protein [Flavilitoribacter nigricans]|uniref:Secretion system C-terminal sorting domain-containing protein n=1 Tax=Flavilitoribacter nigricans (strain ATCC 23147 / DSM 23189 / NBRC 102662 / NCIMB 1420 / SS-2) TaxID=1122177 RepID=A0A2D0N376_FLAN2|nr:T9SS type A sorting domain-containing protein [Flavilitoribacter nigricans]PHN02897.1 hypothetical protein CRP01_29250 [Flavilitoribacter nigricans DSM 23189 = NBRC 102662]
MKKPLSWKFLLCILPVLGVPAGVGAQLYIQGTTVHISPNALLHSNDDVTNTGGGTLINEGMLSTSGSITNSGSATLQGNGRYKLAGDWQNSATFSAGTSTVNFVGPANSMVTSGGDAFHILEMTKAVANLTLADDLGIGRRLEFLSGQNKILLPGKTLAIGSGGDIRGYDINNYIVTGSDGELIKSDLGDNGFTFPIGFDLSSYNPMVVRQHGTSGPLGVRCHEQHFANGSSGMPLSSEVVDASWEITRASAGVNDLEVTLLWELEHELAFDRNDSAVGFWDGANWDYGALPGSQATILGSTTYSQTRTGISGTGLLGVRSGMSLVDAHDARATSSALIVYPNPFAEKLTVLHASGKIWLYTLSGQLVMQIDPGYGPGFSVPTEIDLGHLPAGIYLLKTTGMNGLPVSTRLIKMAR